MSVGWPQSATKGHLSELEGHCFDSDEFGEHTDTSESTYLFF